MMSLAQGRRWLAAVALAIPLVATAQNLLTQLTDTTVAQTEQVRAELMAHAPDGAAPGKTVWLGLQLTHAPEWHTYWKNSGDSGQPTELQWTLPPGVRAGPVARPGRRPGRADHPRTDDDAARTGTDPAAHGTVRRPDPGSRPARPLPGGAR